MHKNCRSKRYKNYPNFQEIIAVFGLCRVTYTWIQKKKVRQKKRKRKKAHGKTNKSARVKANAYDDAKGGVTMFSVVLMEHIRLSYQKIQKRHYF